MKKTGLCEKKHAALNHNARGAVRLLSHASEDGRAANGHVPHVPHKDMPRSRDNAVALSQAQVACMFLYYRVRCEHSVAYLVVLRLQVMSCHVSLATYLQCMGAGNVGFTTTEARQQLAAG